MKTLHLTLAAIFAITSCVGVARAADWAQAAANPARTAHVSDEPQGKAKTIWVKRFGDEMMHNTNQPIIVGGVVFVGAANGAIHALDAASGNEKWSAKAAGPVISALASDGKLIFAASMDGALYAFDITNGQQKWVSKMSRRGFSTAPLLMDDNIYTGSRDGILYAVKAADGAKLWNKDTGAPIDQSAAGAEGKIVFVNKAMQAYCLKADSGDTIWQKDVIGSSVRDYWPVIYKGKVLIRTRQAGPRDLSGGMNELQNSLFFPAKYADPKPEEIKFKAKTKEDIFKEQEWVQDYFEKNPKAHTWTVLNFSDGSEPYKVSIVAGCCNTGAIPPPAIAGDGNVYTPFPTSASRNGVINITRLGLGALNIETGLITEPLLCGGGEGVSDVIGVRTPFELTSDETVGLSSGGDLLVGIRGDTAPGGINVRTRQTVKMEVPPRPRSQDSQPGANIVAISGKYLAYVKNSELICLAADSFKEATGN
jgi:outer membrane protein assembly factor BamB